MVTSAAGEYLPFADNIQYFGREERMWIVGYAYDGKLHGWSSIFNFQFSIATSFSRSARDPFGVLNSQFPIYKSLPGFS